MTCTLILFKHVFINKYVKSSFTDIVTSNVIWFNQVILFISQNHYSSKHSEIRTIIFVFQIRKYVIIETK